jgi:hypothetical protein
MKRRGYEEGQADLAAYVALDRRLVAYLPARQMAQSSMFRLKEYGAMYVCQTGMFIEDYPLSAALDQIL